MGKERALKGLEYTVNLSKAMAAWAECNPNERGFIMIAYEKADEKGVMSTVAGVGDLDILATIAINSGVNRHEKPMNIFVGRIRDKLAEKYLGDMLKGGSDEA